MEVIKRGPLNIHKWGPVIVKAVISIAAELATDGAGLLWPLPFHCSCSDG